MRRKKEQEEEEEEEGGYLAAFQPLHCALWHSKELPPFGNFSKVPVMVFEAAVKNKCFLSSPFFVRLNALRGWMTFCLRVRKRGKHKESRGLTAKARKCVFLYLKTFILFHSFAQTFFASASFFSEGRRPACIPKEWEMYCIFYLSLFLFFKKLSLQRSFVLYKTDILKDNRESETSQVVKKRQSFYSSLKPWQLPESRVDSSSNYFS